MKKKTYELINGIIGGVAAIATSIVVYVSPTGAAAICGAIVAVSTIISEIMGAFIKEV